MINLSIQNGNRYDLFVILGTAADIIEFFDSFKDDKIAAEPLLVLLTLAIW
jgi:hypothetical protein